MLVLSFGCNGVPTDVFDEHRPLLVLLFGEVVEPLGHVALLEEMSHWGEALKMTPASGSCLSALPPGLPPCQELP